MNISSKKASFLIFRLPVIIFSVLFITTPWTHIFFSIGEDLYTEYMPLFDYLFIPVLFIYWSSMVIVSAYLCVFRYKRNTEEYKVARSMIIFVLLAVGLYLLQNFTYGAMCEEYLSMTVAFSTPLVFLTTDLSVHTLVRQEAQNATVSADLKTASKIQRDALPKNHPAFPSHPGIDLAAHLETAKEVGGDFYDYFDIDGSHVCFVIADVSGKGIPAALCMMTVKTMIKDYAGICDSTSEIFTLVNRKFCEQNQTGMFVTAWIGIINTETMMLQYTNAGHNQPFYAKEGEQYSLLKDKHGLFLGGMDDTEYRHSRIQLHPRDRLFLYTDGITEAHNMKSELFGKERLEAFLNDPGEDTKSDDMQKIISEVNKFAGDAPQFDDMTVMMIKIL